jgi:hypothetical protein
VAARAAVEEECWVACRSLHAAKTARASTHRAVRLPELVVRAFRSLCRGQPCNFLFCAAAVRELVPNSSTYLVSRWSQVVVGNPERASFFRQFFLQSIPSRPCHDVTTTPDRASDCVAPRLLQQCPSYLVWWTKALACDPWNTKGIVVRRSSCFVAGTPAAHPSRPQLGLVSGSITRPSSVFVESIDA